ncbi:uncharacterized protein [Halyomorpha halys]|uniref:uncharacterized protein isoform X2 n=1 Tax=Halyomorpha halys TaxID=286706 RepID=UPI0006D4E623|nr:uncharacterized protein LOC106692977 isoform X2 [Halyomorpha halys]
MKIHYISSIFLLFLLHSICEGKFYFSQESSELDEDDDNALHIIQDQIENKPSDYCKCSSDDCECCYNFGTHLICSMTKIVTLEDDGNELAIQGRLSINNGSIFTCSIKFKEIPKLCYHHRDFNACFNLKHEEVETNKLKICGHIRARYSSSVLLNVNLFCKTFEVKKSVRTDPVPTEESNPAINSIDEKKFISQYFGQFALQ